MRSHEVSFVLWWILFSIIQTLSAIQDVNWDITFLLSRRYDIARADEDFPIVIQPPQDGTLYHVPAMKLFPDGQLPPDNFFIHLMFKPRKESLDRGVYLAAIRDPDGTQRFSIRLAHVSEHRGVSTYQVIFTYHPVESDEEKQIDFSIPWTDGYWHLGILIEKEQIKFFTSCQDSLEVPYNTVNASNLLGTRLFRDGATFYALNSGLHRSPDYFSGLLKSFYFHSSPDAVKDMCRKSEPSDGSGDGNVGIDFDPNFGNVLVTNPTSESDKDYEQKQETSEATTEEQPQKTNKPKIDRDPNSPFRFKIIVDNTTGTKYLADIHRGIIIENIEILENDLVKLENDTLIATGNDGDERFLIIQNNQRDGETMIFDRITGQQVPDATFDADGVIHLPDGSMAVARLPSADRYLVVTDRNTGRPVVFDRHAGIQVDGAILESNGLITLPSGQTVASASKLGQRYHVVTDENGNVEAVYNRTTGELITGATTNQNGIITFADGQLGIVPSSETERYVVINHPITGDLVVLDRRTGTSVTGATLEDNGLIRFDDGTYAAPAPTEGESRYLVVVDPETTEKRVYDRLTGDLILGATADEHGLITFPDGTVFAPPTEHGYRYRIVTSPHDNRTIVIDSRTGQPMDGATIMENGLVRLEDGTLVAPGSTDKSQYLIVENVEHDGPAMIFDRITGQQVPDATFDADGVIHLPDGSMAVARLPSADRYLVVTDRNTGRPVVFDRHAGIQVDGAILESNGLITLPSGQTVASASKLGQRYHVVTDENGNVEAVYNRTTGELITGATTNQNGIITFADGQLGIVPSSETERYVVINHPITGDLVVLDRRTGTSVTGATLEDNGLIRFDDGTYAAPAPTEGESRYLVVVDPETTEKRVYDRLTGDLILGATADEHGLITFPDGTVFAPPTEHGYRYRIVTSPHDNRTIVIDSRTGQPMDGATIMENGLVRLEDGTLVAPGSTDKSQYLIVENVEHDGPAMIFDRITGQQVPDATFDADGVIHLPHGSMAVARLPSADRYLVVTDRNTGRPVVFDRHAGIQVDGAILESNGLITLPSGQTVASASKLGQRYHVVTDENGNVEAVYNRTTGELITGATTNQNGIITFADGQLGIVPSSETERYVVINHPITGDLVVLDRRTGTSVTGATLEDNGLIRFDDGTYAAPAPTEGESRYLVVVDPETTEKRVYDRLTGDLILGATADEHGLITFPDGTVFAPPTEHGYRYRIVTSPHDNRTIVIDSRTGQPMDGATIMENGLVRLEDGTLVAPGSTFGSRFLVVDIPDGVNSYSVYDRISGALIVGAVVDSSGIIRFPDGSIDVLKLPMADRYLVVRDPSKNSPLVFDRHIGSEVEGTVVESNGFIRLPSGTIVIPASENGSKLLVLPSTAESDLVVYDRFSGVHLAGAYIDDVNVIHLPNGTLATKPSQDGGRYFAVTLTDSGRTVAFDRRSGCQLKGEVLGDSGFFRLSDRNLLALSNSSAGQFLLLNVSDLNSAVVFDRNTGEPIAGAIVLNHEVIQLPNDSLAIATSETGARYYVFYDNRTELVHIFDRRTGDLLPDAKVLPSGLIELADGRIRGTAHPGNFRYLIATDPSGVQMVFDAISGEPIADATILEDGFIRLPSGETVAPGRVNGPRYVVRADPEGRVLAVFDTLVGSTVSNAIVRADGMIQFSNGVLFPVVSTTLPRKNRYFVMKNTTDQSVSVYDLVTGALVTDYIVTQDGQYQILDGTVVSQIYNDTISSLFDQKTQEPDHLTSSREKTNTSLENVRWMNSTVSPVEITVSQMH
ncbi:hypothetical protein FBUS_00102 [Fasciolopsis buskii]|uniref:Uncharacterized protein n=1 Tax=Fasciolopsis buskii TaxID=27845 RepID=A0A8E0VHM7_9TREM|nr:hypothetical protein FBUS_00102 [Fasciolopsis buski]